MLTEAGAEWSPSRLDECPPLERVLFTGGHDATAQAVLTGKVDAGGIELRILRRLESEGKVPHEALRVIARHEVQGYPWVMRARRFAAVTAGDYEEIRREATRLGLLKSQS